MWYELMPSNGSAGSVSRMMEILSEGFALEYITPILSPAAIVYGAN